MKRIVGHINSKRWAKFCACLLSTLFLGLACSSIRLESGSPAGRSSSSGSEVQASQMQGRWLDHFRSLPMSQKTVALKRLIDSVNVSLLRYGDDIAEEWRDVEAREGRDVAGSEFVRMVDLRSPDSDPFIRAYYDMTHEAMSTVLANSQANFELSRLLPLYAQQMKIVAAGVTAPTGSLTSYLRSLDEMREVSTQLRHELDAELGL